MVYVSQIIMLYTLNLYSETCQLYLNKTGQNISVHQKKKWKEATNWECKDLELRINKELP